MKLNEILIDFEIFLTNEELDLLPELSEPKSAMDFTERQQTIIENLIRKNMVSKVVYKGNQYVVKNEKYS
jgi:hypothetical protein